MEANIKHPFGNSSTVRVDFHYSFRMFGLWLIISNYPRAILSKLKVEMSTHFYVVVEATWDDLFSCIIKRAACNLVIVLKNMCRLFLSAIPDLQWTAYQFFYLQKKWTIRSSITILVFFATKNIKATSDTFIILLCFYFFFFWRSIPSQMGSGMPETRELSNYMVL